jgi:hypothetical protein
MITHCDNRLEARKQAGTHMKRGSVMFYAGMALVVGIDIRRRTADQTPVWVKHNMLLLDLYVWKF